MKECNDFEEVVHLYIDNQLTDPEKIKFERHMSTCEECKEEYSELLALKNVFGNLQEEELPPNFKSLLHEKLLLEIEPMKKPKTVFLKNHGVFIKTSLGIAATLVLAFTANWAFMNYKEFGDSITGTPTPFSMNETNDSDSSILTDSNLEVLTRESSLEEFSMSDMESFSDMTSIDSERASKGSFNDAKMTLQEKTFTENSLNQNNTNFQEINSENSQDDSKGSTLSQSTSNSLNLMERSIDASSMNAEMTVEYIDNKEFSVETETSSNEFQIRYMDTTSRIFVNELFLNKNASTSETKEFETKIDIITPNPVEITSLLISLAQFQNYSYTQSQVFDQNPQNLYTFVKFNLSAEDYNNTIRTIKLLEEIPSSFQFNEAEIGSMVNLTITIYRD
jgi:hypothetical protein